VTGDQSPDSHFLTWHRLTRPLKLTAFGALWGAPTCRYAENKKDQANHQEKEEQEFGNSRSRSGNAGESKNRRHQRDYQKD
jgi:hypothetical protein